MYNYIYTVSVGGTIMDIALKIAGLAAIFVLIIIAVWGFVLFYNLVVDTKKQNMMLYSIIEKLSNKLSDMDHK